MVQLSGKYCGFGQAFNPLVFRMSLFGAAHGLGDQKDPTLPPHPVPGICHAYPAMMKLGAVIPYLKEI